MRNQFYFQISGVVNDVGGSWCFLRNGFFGTWQDAVALGWSTYATPELLAVWATRVNPHAIDQWGNPEEIAMTNADGDIRLQVHQ